MTTTTTHSPDDIFFFDFPIFRSHHEQLEVVYAENPNPNLELRTQLAQNMNIAQPMIAAWFCLKRGSDQYKNKELELQIARDENDSLKSGDHHDFLKKELKKVQKENETLKKGHQIQKSLLKSFCAYQKDPKKNHDVVQLQFQEILSQLDAPKCSKKSGGGFIFKAPKKGSSSSAQNEKYYKEMEQDMEKMRFQVEQAKHLEQTYLEELEQKEAELVQKGAELQKIKRKLLEQEDNFNFMTRRLDILEQERNRMIAETTRRLEEVDLADTVVFDETMLDVQVVEDTVVVDHKKDEGPMMFF